MGSEWIGLNESNLIINICTVLGPVSKRQAALTKWPPLVILECLGRKFIGLCGGWGPEKTPLPHGTELKQPLTCMSVHLLCLFTFSVLFPHFHICFPGPFSNELPAPEASPESLLLGNFSKQFPNSSVYRGTTPFPQESLLPGGPGGSP